MGQVSGGAGVRLIYRYWYGFEMAMAYLAGEMGDTLSMLNRERMADAITRIAQAGAVPTEAQAREHARLRALGFEVELVDSKELIDIWAREGAL